MRIFSGQIKVLGKKLRQSMIARGLTLLALVMLALPPALPVQAQTAPSNPTPDKIMYMAKADPAGAQSWIQQITGADAGTARQIINNITQMNNPKGLLQGLIDGKISPDIAAKLSQIKDMGNLNMDQLRQMITQLDLDKFMAGKLPPGANMAQMQNVMNQIQDILKIAGDGNIQRILMQGGAKMITELIAKLFPELAKLLGPLLQKLLEGFIVSKDPDPGGGGCPCEPPITKHHETIKGHMTNKRKEHEMWMVTEFFTKHVAPALMLMAEQLTVVGMQQVQIIGSFFDAKHQLETQRLMQRMTAIAHKDYQPSEGLCTFGTSVRSLAGSERAADMAQSVIAARTMQRQLNQGDSLSVDPTSQSDRASRLQTFIEKFCDKKDNNETLDELCKDGSASAEQKNKDIDYTRAVETKLTLDLNFHAPLGNENPSEDEENIFALSANLYGHDTMPYIDQNLLGPRGKDTAFDAEQHLMAWRALAAKRSVAQNSFAAITGMKAAGTPEAQPYLYKMVAELGVPEDDLEALLGKNPSYFAQMEILTKKALQNPVFYTELYDKPVNVDRKAATLQAIGLMQDRDIYKSLIRSEAILSVLLESMLSEEYNRAAKEISDLNKRYTRARPGKAGP